MSELQIQTTCPVHKIEYVLIAGNNQEDHLLFCAECQNETQDNNIILERKFIELVRNEYYILTILPFIYSILSLILDFGEIFGFTLSNPLTFKAISTVVLSMGLSIYLIKSRRKTLRPVIPLYRSKTLDKKKAK